MSGSHFPRSSRRELRRHRSPSCVASLRKAFTVRRLLVLARGALVNTLLVLVSLLSTYVAMEYAVFRVFLPASPIDIHSRVPELADVLTQATKSAYLPK